MRFVNGFKTIYLFELTDESKVTEYDMMRPVGCFKTIYLLKLNDESEATE